MGDAAAVFASRNRDAASGSNVAPAQPAPALPKGPPPTQAVCIDRAQLEEDPIADHTSEEALRREPDPDSDRDAEGDVP